MRRALLPARWRSGSGALSWPMAERYFWTKWEIFRWSFSPSYCGCCRNTNLSVWGARARSAWMCGWWRQPTGIWRRWSGEKQFREDLYFRLNVFPIRIPPLRERAGDIPLLVRHYMNKYAQRMNKRIETIPEEAMAALCRYSWPGNIRELQNFIERAVILTPGSVLQIQINELQLSGPIGTTVAGTLEDVERERILEALRETDAVIGGEKGAAARLGLKRTTLLSKMQKLGISRYTKYSSVMQKEGAKERPQPGKF